MVWGTCQAGDEKQVRAFLPAGSSVNRAGGAESLSLLWKNSVGVDVPQEVSLFLRQLALCFRAGLPLVNSLDVVLRGEWSKPMNALLDMLSRGLSSGHPLSRLLARFPNYFTPVIVGLIRAGEESGSIEHSMGQAAELMERQLNIHRRVRAALVYPAFILGLFAVLMLVLVVWIGPLFANVFVSMKVDLPLTLKICLWAKALFGDPLSLFLMVETLLFLTYLGYQWTKSERGSDVLGRLLMAVPFVSQLVVYAELSRFLNCLSAMVSSGTNLLRAVKLSSTAVSNPVIRRGVDGLSQTIAHGESMSSEIATWEWAPRDLSALFEVAEEAGDLTKNLDIARNKYEADLQLQIETALSLLEPIVIAMMGIFVGVFLISLMVPLFQLFQVLGA